VKYQAGAFVEIQKAHLWEKRNISITRFSVRVVIERCHYRPLCDFINDLYPRATNSDGKPQSEENCGDSHSGKKGCLDRFRFHHPLRCNCW
jgi:hypothetical protein